MSSGVRAALAPGTVSAMRPVPASIARPEYVGKPAPTPYDGPERKDAETIAAMRIAGRLAADALAEVGQRHRARRHHRRARPHRPRVPVRPRRLPVDARLPRLPEVAVHLAQRGHLPRHPGLAPSCEDGDICNIDITAFIGGVHGDTNATFLVGDVDEEARLLVERTREATRRAIKAVAPGRPINVIGRVIETYARRFGYGVVRDFTGHGIGTSFHSGLVIPHYDDPPQRHRHRARHDLHHRADDHPRHATTTTSGTTAGRSSRRTGAGPRSSSTPSSSPTPAARSSPSRPAPTKGPGR